MKMLRIIYNKILPALFWVMLLLAFDSPATAILTLLCATLHELGHICAATVLLNKNISLPKAVLYGIRIHTGGGISYKDELIIALGGPLANFIAALCTLPFLFIGEYPIIFLLINLFTAVSNLIPLRSYDGQRIISSLIAPHLTPYAHDTVIHCICIATSALGCVLSLFFIGRIGDGWWIFALFFISLINEITLHSKKSQHDKKREYTRF